MHPLLSIVVYSFNKKEYIMNGKQRKWLFDFHLLLL